MTKRTTVSLLAVAALAGPAAAQAATPVGSDMGRAAGNDHTLYCGSTPTDTWPCTLVADRQPWEVDAPDEHVITTWRAQLTSGTQARLRLLRRNGDGSFTGVATSDAVTAPSDGVHEFRTHLEVPAGDYTIGLDLLAGNVGAVEDSENGYVLGFTDPPLADGATGTMGSAPYELLVQAGAETDHDRDGKGDETEDDCLWECPGGGSPDPGGPVGPSGPGSGGAKQNAGGGAVPHLGGSLAGPGPAKEPETPKTAPFTIDPRGLLRPGAEGRAGTFEVFAENTGSGDATATFEIRAGGKLIASRTFTKIESGDEVVPRFKLPKGQLRRLRAKGRLKLALSAVATHTSGSTPIRQDLTVLAGGAGKYDGTYKGPGPITFVVEGGAVRTVSSQVNAFCPRTNRHQQLSIFSIDGFPALVKPDGSFSADGRAGGQALKYHGRLSLRGTSKGYASAYRFELGVSDGGRYFTDGCTGALNWTARRTR
jgi:hypothetical protein